MTVRLRPHHLLCLLTYVGKGYSPAFTANFTAIVKRLGKGEDILIVTGPDDICSALTENSEAHCFRDSVTGRDRLAAHDIGALLGRPVAAGHRMTPDPQLLQRMRTAFSGGHIRRACTGCQWSTLCSTIAAGDYDETHMRIYTARS